MKASIKVKRDVYVFLFFVLQKKTSFFLWNSGHLKCTEKCSWSFQKSTPENYTIKGGGIKVSYSHILKALMWKQVCWVQNSKCASHGILTLCMLLVKYYGCVEYKDWPRIRVLQRKMCLFDNFMSKNLFFETFQILTWDSYKKTDT